MYRCRINVLKELNTFFFCMASVGVSMQGL